MFFHQVSQVLKNYVDQMHGPVKLTQQLVEPPLEATT